MVTNVKNALGKPVSLVWLRRDLRLYDHAAFAAAARNGYPVQAVFVFDTDILTRFKRPEDRRLTFIAEALCRIHEQLAKRGGGLLVLHGRAQEIIPKLCDAFDVAHLFAAEDFEPATRSRDVEVENFLRGKTQFQRIKDHLLLGPDDVLKADGTPFKVFTPYSHAWRKVVKAKAECLAEKDAKGLQLANWESSLSKLQSRGFVILNPLSGPEAMLSAIGYKLQNIGWSAADARKRLHDFTEKRMRDYNTKRDFMAEDGASRLSPYLRFGLLSIRECVRLALEQEMQGSTGASTWLNELVWRDFYAMILWHFPETARLEMQAQYRGIEWRCDKSAFARFTTGKTGYPVVDAAMRELLETGYMHNRARMIVASFMTKDLLLDWRMGEEHFAQYLMDYELSSNVGGWQWAASTGTDAQPYFRVFNPVLQGKKFDPEGKYIRRYIPELAHLSAKDIHEPWKCDMTADYPPPMVDHQAARNLAIGLFKKTGAA